MRTFRFFSLAATLIGLAAGPVAGWASTTAPSDPVGALQLPLRGNSDTIVSLPMLRPALVEASISSLSTSNGTQLTLLQAVPSLPAEGGFVLVLTGSLEGAIMPISGASGALLTVSPGSFSVASLKTEALNGVGQGDLVAVVPYWTLDTVFPGGQGVNVSADPLTHASEVLLYDDSTPGINLAAVGTYYYYAGSAGQVAGWYRTGGGTALQGTQRFAPQRYFTVRHNIAGDTALVVSGVVQMAGFRVALAQLQALSAQDNLVALPLAVPMTLGGIGLGGTSAFASSTSTIVTQDQVLVYDNTTVVHQKAPSATFFYYAGSSSKAAGWYKVGSTATESSAFVLNPGEGVVVRKKGTATPHVDPWSFVPSYLSP
jgi:uncharacterized protein (TIGR02597 family)